MQGKLKLSGNMALGKMKLPCALSGAAMKLDQIFKSAVSGASATDGFKSDVIFEEIKRNIQQNPDVAKKINGWSVLFSFRSCSYRKLLI